MPTVTNCKVMDGYPVATQGSDLQLTYEAVYNINTDDSDWRNAGAIGAVAQLAGSPDRLPRIGQIYQYGGETNQGSFCQYIRLSPDPVARQKWAATVRWKPLAPGKQAGDLDPAISPINRPKREWLETVTETQQVSEGWNEIALPVAGEDFGERAIGTKGPIVNAAGESYDEALYADDTHCVYVQEKNVATPAEAYQLQLTYGRTLNDDEFLTFPKHCAKFIGAETSEPMTERFGNDLVTFYVMTVRIALRRDPWYHHIVNRGYNEVVEARSTGETGLYPIILIDEETGDQRKPSEPVLLTLNGTHEADDLGNTIAYRTREEASYAGLLI